MKERERKIKVPYNFLYTLQCLTKVLKINRDISDPIWITGNARYEEWSGQPLHITIWNIFKGTGGEYFYNDFRSLSFKSDLLLVQEVLLSGRSLLDFSPPDFYGIHAASYERADRLRDGVMTLSRIRHIEGPLRILCKYPEPVLRTPKVALVTKYRINDAMSLMIINVHATLLRSIRRAVEELEHLLEQLPDHTGPIIFAGDFNTFTSRYVRAISQKLHTLGLDYVAIPNDPRRQRENIDQLYVRGLNVDAVWIDTSIRSSDHFPIRATLSLP